MFLCERKKSTECTKAPSPRKRKRTSPIVTAVAPLGVQYCAGAARPPFDEGIQNALSVVEEALKTGWRSWLEDDQNIFKANRILSNWRAFFPHFLDKEKFVPYGAKQRLTYHRAGGDGTGVSPDRRDAEGGRKIENLYRESSGIRERREYSKNEEIKRYLRHCAAVLAINFNIAGEIQCYYDEKKVYVATNNGTDVRNLSAINDRSVTEYEEILQQSYSEIINGPADNDRIFKDKLTDYINDKRVHGPLLRKLRHGLPCPDPLRECKFELIEDDYGIPGLHAERMILYHLRSMKGHESDFLEPLRLGGIRRPCFICSVLCFSDMSQVYPGPVWVSDAASKPRNISEMFLILEAIRKKENKTYISKVDSRLTMDNDTESIGD